MTERSRLLLIAAACAVVFASVLAFLWMGEWIERRSALLIERMLSERLGARVSLGGVELHGLRFEARAVRIDASDRGAILVLDRVAVTPSLGRLLGEGRLAPGRVTVDGARVALDERLLSPSAAGNPEYEEDRAGHRKKSLPPLPDFVRIEDVELTLASHRRGTRVLTLRGELAGDREDEGSRYRISARTAGKGTIEGEARFDRAGGWSATVRVEDAELKSFLELVPEVEWHRPEETRFDGTLSFSSTGGEPVSLSGLLELRALGVEWRPVARSPVATDARLELDAFWKEGILSVPRARLRSRGVEFEWGGNVGLVGEPSAGAPARRSEPASGGERPSEERGRTEGSDVPRGWGPAALRKALVADLRIALGETGCQNVLDAIPEGVLGEFSGFRLDGTIRGRLRLRLEAGRPEETRLEIDVDDRCRFRRAPPAADLARLNRRFVHRVSGEKETILTFETGPSSRNWVGLSSVSPFFVHAVLTQEDGSFFHHRGFVPDAFALALERNLEEGRFASGASTISMQVARNLFLVRDKTLARKAKEILLTWWLEKSLTKREILELYLNLIEFGPGVYGIGPASRHYFGRAPESLSPAEAAFLASVLPAPSRYHRDYERGAVSASSRARVERLLRLMASRGRIDEQALAHGLDETSSMRFHYGPGSPPRRRENFGWAAPLTP